jgi:hypothetical protein
MEWTAFDAKVRAICAKLDLPLKYAGFETRKVGSIESFGGLRVLHANKNVQWVRSGSVSYKGWDCTDPYYQATIDGILWAFWQEGAHGGGIKHSAAEGSPEWARWLAFRYGGEDDDS